MPKGDTLDQRSLCTVEMFEGVDHYKACLRQGRYLGNIPEGRIEHAWEL